MSELIVNDIFDQLFEENKRLISELVFAIKYLTVLNKFKSFVDLIFDKIKTNLDPNIVNIYEDLRKESDETWNSRHSLKDKQLSDQRVNDVFSEKSSNHEIIVVNPDIVTSDQSMDDMSQTNDSINSNTNRRNHSFRVKSVNNESSEQSSDLKKSRTTITSNNEQDFKCCFVNCEKVFNSKLKLIGHQKRCHSGVWFTCERPQCQYKTRTKALIKFHQKSHTMAEKAVEGQSFVCDFQNCGRNFPNRGDLMRHISHHKVMKPFICDYESCNKKFMSQKLLKDHIKECHLTVKQTFKCDVQSCDEEFQTYELLAKHKSIHIVDKPFQCEQTDCRYKAKNLSTLRYHMKIAHKTDRSFKCLFEGCMFATKTNGALKVHIKTVHLNERSFICDRNGCGKAFKTQGGLSSHLRNFHSDLLFDCDWPGCEFFTKSEVSLKSHKRSHENERQYACDWKGCEKRFNFKHQLTIHLRTHTQEKRYACHWPGCQYRCIFGGNLTKHMRIHQK